MSLWDHVKVVHRRRRASGRPSTGFATSCNAYWSPKGQAIQCYALVEGKTVWLARVDVRDHDPLLSWVTSMKERRFTEALRELLPCDSPVAYVEKCDQRTQRPIYFATDLHFDGFDVWSKVQERLAKSS